MKNRTKKYRFPDPKGLLLASLPLCAMPNLMMLWCKCHQHSDDSRYCICCKNPPCPEMTVILVYQQNRLMMDGWSWILLTLNHAHITVQKFCMFHFRGLPYSWTYFDMKNFCMKIFNWNFSQIAVSSMCTVENLYTQFTLLLYVYNVHVLVFVHVEFLGYYQYWNLTMQLTK